MPRLPADRYLTHLERESARFRAVLATCDPDAPVPACPDWSAADLLWHLGEVQWFWSRVVAGRPAGPDALEHPARPGDHAGLLAFFDVASGDLVAELRGAAPAEPAWSWSTEQTVGFTHRRQAHEALIHRLDAEQAAGDVTPLDPVLAADGVREMLGVMLGGDPGFGAFTPWPGLVEVRVADTDDRVRVRVGRYRGTAPDGTDLDAPDLRVAEGHDAAGPAAAAVTGGAADLDAWLWHRADGASLTWEGDAALLEAFRAVAAEPAD